MKLRDFCAAAAILLSSVAPEAQCETLPPVKEIMTAMLDSTSCLNHTPQREALMEQMQVYADSCSDKMFYAYYAATDPAEVKRMENNTIFEYHHESLEKLLREIPLQQVPQGHVVLWHLYNMGYVVKTPSHTFGIDLKHRDAARLEPLLEFLCITHNHQDHFSMPLIEAMVKAGKTVYSNFLDCGTRVGTDETLRPVDGIEIITTVVDHNPQLVNFVVDYEIDCGADTGNKVILHLGDSRNWEQLRKTKEVDVLIPHLAVGLDMPRAVEKLNPKVVLMSHIMELSHPIDKWRWSYPYGLARCRDLTEALGKEEVYLPVWGEKIVF